MNEKKQIRCAIYTRKSTDEGLELDYNSLDAQRDAAENYISSQKHEGWICLKNRYDDGGYSGGDMDRPAAQKLLADVQAGKIDCIVVYKVDRLSRSLMDFAKIMQILDKHNVSFVSVTQQFNTTSSMGRLTLNILLSFAQFEREIISERTRDKIASARRKGKWTGGRPLLGYDINRDRTGSKLVVNEKEAEQVRQIYYKYLESASVRTTLRWMDQQDILTKQYTRNSGKVLGGERFSQTTLYALLKNVTYMGKIAYKDQAYDGEHEAIVDEGLFRQVQSLLKSQKRRGGLPKGEFLPMLKGIVRCKYCGCAMTHHWCAKSNKRYRYYVCLNAQKRGYDSCVAPTLPAGELEEFVVGQIKTKVCSDSEFLQEVVGHAQTKLNEDIDRRQALVDMICTEIQDLERQLALAQSNADPDETRKIEKQIKQKQMQVKHENAQITAAQQRVLDSDELTGSIESFDPAWNNLSPSQQQELVQLLIRQIEWDGEEETISVTFHEAGINADQEICV